MLFIYCAEMPIIDIRHQLAIRSMRTCRDGHLAGQRDNCAAGLLQRGQDLRKLHSLAAAVGVPAQDTSNLSPLFSKIQTISLNHMGACMHMQVPQGRC